jgi:hypothetical protein
MDLAQTVMCELTQIKTCGRVSAHQWQFPAVEYIDAIPEH